VLILNCVLSLCSGSVFGVLLYILFVDMKMNVVLGVCSCVVLSRFSVLLVLMLKLVNGLVVV